MAPQVTGHAPRTPPAPPPPPPKAPPATSAKPAAAPSAPPASATAERDKDKLETGKTPWAPRYEDARVGKSVLAPNTQGPAVKKLQDDLAMAGYDVSASGVYDAKTKAAVTDFQRSHGLTPGPQSPAGWADARTLTAVEQDLSARRAAVSKFPKGSEDRATVLGLVKSPGFNALSNRERDALLKTVGGTDHPSTEARANAKRLLMDNGYKEATPAKQKALLDDFLTRGGHLPGNVDVPPGTYQGKAVPHEIALVKDEGACKAHKIEIDGREIPVLSQNAGVGDTASVEETAKAIASLPKADRDHIKQVVILDRHHVDGPETAAAFKPEDGKLQVFKNAANKDPDHFAATLTHEVGHGVSHASFGDVGDPRWAKWERAVKSDGLPPSRYAKTGGADEDFSESYALYRATQADPAAHAAARAKHPARFAVIDELVAGK